ncbi:MAG: type 1 glutamine amidotransferase domain-containing protein, partial [Undibacterium sp.]|nr:type 1 glutamine amidotransferase domain-containing protein [Undibacterium sp.]
QTGRFIDAFLLKNIDNRWQIISKAAVKQVSKQNGVRILFILSNAHFHGTSQLPAGASFAEIVNAYHTFKQAGYTVDFVSPEGGAVPLAYINTSSPLEKEYLYDSDLMFALKNTKKASQLLAKDYRAVHYIGGSSAMYGVADNQEISRLVMDIYEQHKGIISSVCHGTAGIVYLKTKEGKYLVEGKRISGYPEDFERTTAEYFKQFPFLIKQTVTEHKGSFHFGKPDDPYIEVDGRVVTGQNYQSSALVAQEIIKQLQREASSVK